MRFLDLICANEHVEEDVMLPSAAVSEVLPPCPECGAARTTWWGGGRAPAAKVFIPVHHDGVGWINDESTLKATRELIAKEQRCSVDQIVVNRETKTEIKTRADEVRHRRWARDKQRGLDRAQINEIKDSCRRHGINPLTNKRATKRLPKELK